MSATKLKLGIGLLVLAGAVAFFWLQNQSLEKLRAENESLKQQLAQLNTDAKTLSNRLTAANNAQARPDDQLMELLKLRSEVRALRQQTNELGKQRAAPASVRPKPQPPQVETTAEQQIALTILRMNHSKQFTLGMIMFADDNTNQLPASLEQLAPYFGNDASTLTNLNQFEMVYRGSLTNIPNPSSTIIVRENQARQMPDGKWVKVYGFADGHSEAHAEPDGNFDAWEKARMISPTPNQ